MPRTPDQVRQDDELVAAARAGDAKAYARLYVLHRELALGVARRMVRGQADAEDVVAEAFARLLEVLRRGGGPDAGGFRAYLVAVVRNVAVDRVRRDAPVDLVDDLERAAPEQIVVPFDDRGVVVEVERSLLTTALGGLPRRWQTVLWHLEVLGRTPAQAAPLLGTTANGASALAYRAREGLRQAYLQAHLDRSDATPACGPVVTRLAAWARGRLSGTTAALVGAHLPGCGSCRSLLAELRDVAGHLTRAA